MQRDVAGGGFALNGLSLHTITLSQDGDLQVEFDLPQPQTTAQYHVQSRGSRTLDLYDDPELLAVCRRLFEAVRERVARPDPERAEVHCDRCDGSPCCRKYNVLTTGEDLERLAGRFRMPVAAFRERYATAARDWSGDYPFQLLTDRDEEGEEKCVFLQRGEGGAFRCSVYEDRPRICRDFDMTSCHDFVPVAKISVLSPPGGGEAERAAS